MNTEKQSRLLRHLAAAANVTYKLLILAALLWIGYGVQSIAISLNTPIEDGPAADQSSDKQDQQDSQPQIIKPLLRGQM
jgi:hypothetical protein